MEMSHICPRQLRCKNGRLNWYGQFFIKKYSRRIRAEVSRDVEDHLRLQERGQFMFSRDRSWAKYFVVGIEEMGGYLRSLIKSRDMQTSLNPYAEKMAKDDS